MKAGDVAAMVASRVVFPAMSAFSPSDESDPGLKVYTNPFGQKVLYRPNSLDRMVLWEQWRMKDYGSLRIRPGDVVVDLGGHIGTSTLNYAHHVGPGGTVYSIEALPENFAILARNVERNGLSNVKAFNLAIVGDPHVERIALNTNPYNSGGHSVLELGLGGGRSSTCPAMTLERFFVEQGIERLDILQMDVEGAEFDIFLNTDEALLRSIPQIIFEYHDAFESGHDHFELIELLHGLGFRTQEYRNFIARALKLDTGIIYASREDRAPEQ